MKRSRINPISKKRTCLHCGQHFVANVTELRRGKAKFCTATCWYESQRSKGKSLRTCMECGRQFYNRNKLKYCSAKCFNSRSRKRKVRTCVACGRDFSVRHPSAARKYCSRRCAGVGLRKDAFTACKNCGAEIRWKTVTRERKFCSRECMYSFTQGANHPSFRGGTEHHRGKGWNAARDAARQRDKVCATCGALPTEKQKLSVDHIVPYRLVRQYQRDFPIGPSPNDLINLVSLCRKHHAQKTVVESRILEGDLMGFISEAKRIIPVEILQSALALWGLNATNTTSKTNQGETE